MTTTNVARDAFVKLERSGRFDPSDTGVAAQHEAELAALRYAIAAN